MSGAEEMVEITSNTCFPPGSPWAPYIERKGPISSIEEGLGVRICKGYIVLARPVCVASINIWPFFITAFVWSYKKQVKKLWVEGGWVDT